MQKVFYSLILSPMFRGIFLRRQRKTDMKTCFGRCTSIKAISHLRNQRLKIFKNVASDLLNIYSIKVISYFYPFSSLLRRLHFPLTMVLLLSANLYLEDLPDIVMMVRVFANGPGDLDSIPGQVIPKTLKWYLMAPCLTLGNIR